MTDSKVSRTTKNLVLYLRLHSLDQCFQQVLRRRNTGVGPKNGNVYTLFGTTVHRKKYAFFEVTKRKLKVLKGFFRLKLYLAD